MGTQCQIETLTRSSVAPNHLSPMPQLQANIVVAGDVYVAPPHRYTVIQGDHTHDSN